MPTVLIGGAVGNKPGNGGNAWSRMQWVLGFRRRGWDVGFAEQVPAESPDGRERAYFRRVTGRFGLAGRACLVNEATGETEGLTRAGLRDLAAAADLLVNVGGHLTLPDVKPLPRRAVFFDDDPGYTQVWAAGGQMAGRLAGHDAYLTVGWNVGRPGCPIPTAGVEWRPVLPPVDLTEWAPAPAADPARFTTVASWRGAYGPLVIDGTTYGVKAHEFRKVLDLPRRVPAARFEVALDIHPADGKDRAALEAGGWRLRDPREVAGDPDAYREYVCGSGAEFSPAQGVYAGTAGGWFSDRTACYLAAGRPAVVQDTGLPPGWAGEGLLTFRDADGAAAAAWHVLADYDRHAAAARAWAEARLDAAGRVDEVLEAVG
jgi:hypothetical protein